MTQPQPHLSSLFELEYPQTVCVYNSYPEAQHAVDYLADNKFAVENLAIVGTDLKSMERVTGRKNWGTVLWTGVQSGVSTGLMVALIMWFVQPGSNPLALLPTALVIGILIGVAFAALGYATSRGKRDFTSISQTVATKYEVLCEHKVATQARELLRQAPGGRAAQFDPRNAPQAPAYDPNQYGAPQAGQGYPQSAPAPGPGYGQPGATTPGYGQPAAPAPGYGQPAAPSQGYGDSSYGYGQAHGYGQPPTPSGQNPYGPPQAQHSYGEAGYGQAPAGQDTVGESEQQGRTPRGES